MAGDFERAPLKANPNGQPVAGPLVLIPRACSRLLLGLAVPVVVFYFARRNLARVNT